LRENLELWESEDIEDFLGQPEYIFSKIYKKLSGTFETFFHIALDFGQNGIFFFNLHNMSKIIWAKKNSKTALIFFQHRIF
jgi:hypothetical protein